MSVPVATAAAALQPFTAVSIDKVSQRQIREVVDIIMAVAAASTLFLVQQCINSAECEWQQGVRNGFWMKET